MADKTATQTQQQPKAATPTTVTMTISLPFWNHNLARWIDETPLFPSTDFCSVRGSWNHKFANSPDWKHKLAKSAEPSVYSREIYPAGQVVEGLPPV